MLVLRRVSTSTIKSAFNRQKQEQDYFFKINLAASAVADFNADLAELFEELKQVSPEAYNELNFGEYEAQGYANVKVNGAGLAWGITDRLTAYGSFPWYKAQVKLEVARTKGNNYQSVSRTIEQTGNSSSSNIIAQMAPLLPDINGGVVQGIVTNELNYEPLGDWQAEGMGDIEFGVLYRLTDWDSSGLAVSGGIVLPTGRQDNPNMLQDFAFGDGQTDLFTEFGGGFRLNDTPWNFNSFLRYTYQFGHNRLMRIPDSEEAPYGDQNTLFKEKLGNMIDWRLEGSYDYSSWLRFSGGYAYNHIGMANYQSSYAEANRIHALETERTQNIIRAGVHFSTVPLYQAGDFALPFAANLGFQKIMSGMNTPKYSRVDLEVRFFF